MKSIGFGASNSRRSVHRGLILFVTLGTQGVNLIRAVSRSFAKRIRVRLSLTPESYSKFAPSTNKCSPSRKGLISHHCTVFVVISYIMGDHLTYNSRLIIIGHKQRSRNSTDIHWQVVPVVNVRLKPKVARKVT